ncbi:MAG TPA: helix-turn-helix domain-containing protein [Mycobacterium sp.]|nr:helix-turn-helix domain-containing protein [Mycobacterium sp.]
MTPKVDLDVSQSQAPSPPTERVVAVMGLLGSSPARQFSLAEICRSLDISRATGHAILTTLAAHDWVTRDPSTAGYAWGPAIASLAKPANALMYRADLHALAAATGTQVSLTRREGTTLVVTETAGECLTGPRIGPGMRTPLVAPFGRDYVAWSSSESQKAWLEAIGQPSPALRKRMTAVLKEIRHRGFVVERLTREYVRVYTALRALSGDGEVDVITTQLARAFADLAVIDFLPDELAGNATHRVATVSAPITDADGAVTMSVTAAAFTTLDSEAIGSLGEQVRRTARRIEQHIARYGNSATI